MIYVLLDKESSTAEMLEKSGVACGPLLDSQGSVIGINTAIYGSGNIGIGFALPIARAKTLVEDFRSRVRDTRMRPRMSTLTPREREILKLLAEGNSVKEFAVILGLSVKTVEVHKTNGMRKLGMNSRLQLVRYALLRNWFQDT